MGYELFQFFASVPMKNSLFAALICDDSAIAAKVRPSIRKYWNNIAPLEFESKTVFNIVAQEIGVGGVGLVIE